MAVLPLEPAPDLRAPLTPRRVAVLSVHTSPLDQPGTGDAGGMNVYVRELSASLAQAGVDVRVYVRRWADHLPDRVRVEPGFEVVHVSAGPADEAGQHLTFLVDVSDPTLFSVVPSISATGDLTFDAHRRRLLRGVGDRGLEGAGEGAALGIDVHRGKVAEPAAGRESLARGRGSRRAWWDLPKRATRAAFAAVAATPNECLCRPVPS